MRVGIHQPNYIPWLGYFRKIAMSDVFVFFDNVQMPGGKSYVSRNEVKTPQGRLWLTVPVSNKGEGTSISEGNIADQRWPKKHIKSLEFNYAASRWKSLIVDDLAPFMIEADSLISNLNCNLIEKVARLIGITDVDFVRASELGLEKSGAESISEILLQLKSTEYLTGAGAGSMRHLDVEEFDKIGVQTSFISNDFPEYEQFHGDFEERLSVLDALLCIGPEATRDILLP
jgi:hypothetical protein